MDMEAEVMEAIWEDLTRQAEQSGGALRVDREGDELTVRGPVDLQALAMRIVGMVAGGP